MKARNIILKYICTYVFFLYSSFSFADKNKVYNLTCEHLKNPLGIEVEEPLLGWATESNINENEQSAYQIIVSDNPEEIKKGKGNMWDSGKINPGETNNIKYKGKRLKAKTRYFWRIRSYNAQNIASDWSETAFFEMGMLHPSNWLAQWIGDGKRLPDNIFDFHKNSPAPLLRKDWTIKKPIASARLYITGSTYYETYLNGKKAGDNFSDSNRTFSEKTAFYNTFDVTDMLQQGKNTWGIALSNKCYRLSFKELFNPLREYLTINRPAAYGQLEILYADGHEERILTDLTWKTIPGAIIKNGIYSGEHYDARSEVLGWNLPDAEYFGWRSVVFAESSVKTLKPQMQSPIKKISGIKPIKITEIRPQIFVFDMGQDIIGVVRLKVKGKRGTKITFRYGEKILPDSSVNTTLPLDRQNASQFSDKYTQTVQQEDSYILKGEEKEIWQPRFTLHKFRYVEISGLSERPNIEDIEGVLICSD